MKITKVIIKKDNTVYAEFLKQTEIVDPDDGTKDYILDACTLHRPLNRNGKLVKAVDALKEHICGADPFFMILKDMHVKKLLKGNHKTMFREVIDKTVIESVTISYTGDKIISAKLEGKQFVLGNQSLPIKNPFMQLVDGSAYIYHGELLEKIESFLKQVAAYLLNAKPTQLELELKPDNDKPKDLESESETEEKKAA